MKKGFTLIELLAVIVILGLLTVLIAPKVVNMLEESEKNTYMTSAQNLVKAAEYKISRNEMTGDNQNIKINFATGENINYIEYTGDKPETGQVQITIDGKIGMAVKFGDYCYKKNLFKNEIEVITYDEKKCMIDNRNYTIPELATSGDGLYEAQGEPGRLIYRGANPDNYIWLDENGNGTKVPSEMYRIISYEPDGTMKVIRNKSIRNLPWDKNTSNATTITRNNEDNTYCNYTGAYYGCNAWGNQDNTYYHDATLTNLKQDFSYKYYLNNTSQILQNNPNTGTVSQNSSLNNYLNTEWSPAKKLNNYISEHSFNVGGIYYSGEHTAEEAKTLLQEKEEQNSYTWNGKIGLMNITEYVEASLNPVCTNVYSNYYYNTNYYYDTNNDGQSEPTIDLIYDNYDKWPCSNRSYNWLSRAIYDWTLTPNSKGHEGIFFINNCGPTQTGVASNNIGVRPAFYLKPSIKLSGIGTENNPYYIIEDN